MKNKQNIVLRGVPVSPGYGEGSAYIITSPVARHEILLPIEASETSHEFERIRDAFSLVIKDLARSAENVKSALDRTYADIIHAQIEMLKDPVLLEVSKQTLQKELTNAEKTVKRVFNRFAKKLKSSESTLIRERSDDMEDLANRVVNKLTGGDVNRFSGIPSGSVLIVKRLFPSDAAVLPRKKIKGMALEMGGPASHAAILTRESGIPAVSELPDIGNTFGENDQILVNGNEGTVIINPSENAKKIFGMKKKRFILTFKEARRQCMKKSFTKNRIHIPVFANVSDINDALLAAENGADGIGLYRIEQIYLSSKTLPSSSELERKIRSTLEPFKSFPLNIRLLDTGADKKIPFLNYPDEANPALGLRGIRFLLKYPDVMNPQLKAILSISKTMKVNILVPMVTSVADMREMKKNLWNCAEEMKITTLPGLGAMIETPAAALLAGEIAEYVDFLSIGTNDLTQFTMASGRENHLVADYYEDSHPAVMKLITMVVDAVRDKPVTLCGQLASHIESIPQLLRTGITSLSVSAFQIPFVKEAVRKGTLQDTTYRGEEDRPLKKEIDVMG
jgi:phosphoenolpyruvate-protein phosphotransferase